MMNEMNYRYNNSSQNISVDTSLAKAFVSKPRTQQQIESFGLWASMSKEAKEIGPIFNTVRVMELESIKQVVR